jgi:formate hydrogenlyase subunit 6/NADH:ubiquinone oxidoreductase subunit I
MRKPKLRELGEAIRAFIRGPYTLPFPAEPAPLPDAFRGAPRFHEEDCIGCGACYEVCPANAIHKVDDVEAVPPVRRLTIHHDECIFCGQCELYCTTEKGVIQGHDYDLATFDRAEVQQESVEKELVLCEVCSEIVGAKEHLCWIARKLGAKAYANPTLILMAEEEFAPVVKESPRPKEEDMGRADLMRVLCPKCRREVLVEDLWG